MILRAVIHTLTRPIEMVDKTQKHNKLYSPSVKRKTKQYQNYIPNALWFLLLERTTFWTQQGGLTWLWFSLFDSHLLGVLFYWIFVRSVINAVRYQQAFNSCVWHRKLLSTDMRIIFFFLAVVAPCSEFRMDIEVHQPQAWAMSCFRSVRGLCMGKGDHHHYYYINLKPQL